MLFVFPLQLGLLEVRMHLNLVHRRHNLRDIQQLVEMINHEVADADRPNLAIGMQGFEGAVGLQRPVER